MQDAEALMRRRAGLVEHPFGTHIPSARSNAASAAVTSCCAGFDKMRGEWSLMALCYNFTRVLNIIDFDGFIDYLAKRTAARSDFASSNHSRRTRAASAASAAFLRSSAPSIRNLFSSL